MESSARVAILFRLAELARRFGMKPSEADAWLVHFEDDEQGIDHFKILFSNPPLEKEENFNRMMEALGATPNYPIVAQELDEMEDIVERAMSIAPRARSR